ncbi:MAG: agmatine deiminase family protein [Bacteroidales bacterium]|jgi:agmatine/peptidylarginine deiminase|nr:agmatine deiminase family protein [Bacteroidales bacterium]
MKLKLIPDYNREIDTIFLVSPLDLRDTCWNEFTKFLQIIIEIIIKKNKEQKVVICCREKIYNKTKDLIFKIPYFSKLKNNEQIINFINVEILDIWIRDYFSCANIDLENKVGVLKAIYAPNYNTLASTDNEAGQYLAQHYFDKVLNIPFKLDGGNVISNSEYIFITESLYTENSNIEKKQINKFFEETFEQKLITLPVESLDVIGHTDSILRFLDDKTILLPIYDKKYKDDNRYINNITKILSEKLGLEYKFIFLPSYLDDKINEDNIYSAKGLFLNYFRFEDHIIFPCFEDLGDYQNKIIDIINKEAPNIKIHFTPCDEIAFLGGALHCISNLKYK